MQQAVAFGGVVLHPGQGAADLAQGLVVEVTAPAALHQAAGLAQPGGGLVEVGDTALVVTVGQVAELEVLDAALEAVQRVPGQGVRAGRGHSAEGSGGDSDAQAARGQALGEPGTRSQFPERTRPVSGARPMRALPGDRGFHPVALQQHGLHRGHQLGSLDNLDLRVQLRPGQLAKTLREGQQAVLTGVFPSGRLVFFGLLGRRVPVGLLLQGLGEGVRPPVRRYVRDHWRHLLSS